MAVPGLGLLGLLLVQNVDQGLRAHIREQHETLGLVPIENFGHAQTGGLQQLLHLHKGAAVFFIGRCIHDDAAGACARINAQIAPETGIGRGQAQRVGPQILGRRNALQPSRKSAGALRIRPNNGGGVILKGEGGSAHG